MCAPRTRVAPASCRPLTCAVPASCVVRVPCLRCEPFCYTVCHASGTLPRLTARAVGRGSASTTLCLGAPPSTHARPTRGHGAPSAPAASSGTLPKAPRRFVRQTKPNQASHSLQTRYCPTCCLVGVLVRCLLLLPLLLLLFARAVRLSCDAMCARADVTCTATHAGRRPILVHPPPRCPTRR